MAILTVARPAAVPMPPSFSSEPFEATLHDVDGISLTGVDVLGPARGGRLSFDDVNEPSALLDYYFGRGGRQIMLRLNDGTIEGWLETHWEGTHRSWWLQQDA